MDFTKNEKLNSGFSLVELIIVIAVLAVIAAIAVPNFLASLERSKYTSDIAAAKTIAEVVQIYSAEKEGVKIEDLEVKESADEPMKSILDKLDGKLPEPVSKVMRTGGASFYVNVDADTNEVIVTAGKKSSGLEVYPYPVDEKGNATRP